MHTSGLYQIIPRSKVVFSVRQYTPPSCLIWQSYHAELAFKTNRHYSLIVGDERPQSKEYIMAESAVSLSCYCFIYYIIELSHKNSNYLHPDRFPSVWEHVRPEWSSPTTAVSPFSASHVWINEKRINWIEVWVSEFASTKLLICQLHKNSLLAVFPKETMCDFQHLKLSLWRAACTKNDVIMCLMHVNSAVRHLIAGLAIIQGHHSAMDTAGHVHQCTSGLPLVGLGIRKLSKWANVM